jgi:DNA replication and repair protein RecF
MHLEKICLINYKNYEDSELIFSPQINVFTGMNGSGKTNLLDAVYYLSLTKSAFHNNDALNIRHGQAFFRLTADFKKGDQEFFVEAAFSGGQKKLFKVNKYPYEKIRDHIGQFPVILITPYDTDVIREGSEERRKFFDGVLSQLDKVYLSELMRYNQILKQRNSLLKQFNERNYVDHDLVSTYDEQLLDAAEKIYETRKQFINDLTPLFEYHYKKLSDENEKVSLTYDSQLQQQDFKEIFKSSLKTDIILQRTRKGVHKDDYTFNINDQPLKSFGSQGQQKSFVISLKLAQFDLIKNKKGIKPILLLDDIFDKLDDQRITRLMEMVAEDSFGQLFVTDARIKRADEVLSRLKSDVKVFTISQGKVSES